MRRLSVMLCAALAVGCGESLSPDEVAGTYALQCVDSCSRYPSGNGPIAKGINLLTLR